MTDWLLDDGPFGQLAKQFDGAWRWPAGTVHVVHEVAEAAPLDKSGRTQKLLALGEPGASAVRVHRPLGSSDAATYLFSHIRPKGVSATKNLGEDVAIALAATDFGTAVFVTLDKAAAFMALAELGPGRVATPLDVWADLHQRGRITKGQFAALMDRSIKGSGLPGLPRRF